MNHRVRHHRSVPATLVAVFLVLGVIGLLQAI
jgi:hypothetical protein